MGGVVIDETRIHGPRRESGGDLPPSRPRRDHISWRPPNGRDLLAGVAVLAVLYAILVVFTSDAAPARREGSAEALPRPRTASPDVRSSPPPWSEVPIATRVTELGPALARPVTEGLSASRAKLARCAALDPRRRDQGDYDPEATPLAPPEIILSLAARAGAIHVEAVEVRSAGETPELVDCARRLLAGAAYPAPEAVPGRRYRLVQILE
jgi:hypothetical protein